MQINVDRKIITTDIILDRAKRHRMDIILMGEPNKKTARRNGWFTEEQTDAAIIIINKDLAVHDSGGGIGYVWAELDNIVAYSCYCSPNISMDRYVQHIDSLGADLIKQKKPVIIGGDFNAKAAEWGSPTEDRRGQVLMDWASGADLTILNRGGNPTFVRGTQKSFIDVTLCSTAIAPKIKNWKVIQTEETLGNHRIITYEYREKGKAAAPRNKITGWITTQDGLNKLGRQMTDRLGRGELEGSTPEYKNYIGMVVRSCDTLFPRKNNNNRRGNRRATYWWCDDVKIRRKDCIRSRRKATRTNRTGTQQEREEAAAEYRQQKREYARAIARAKRAAWKKLLEELDNDEWGQGYKLVVKKTHLNRTHKMGNELQWKTARELFPVIEDKGETKERRMKEDQREFRAFTEEELGCAIERMKNGKAPGPDGILPEIAKAALREERQTFLKIANAALRNGRFPEEMKEARLVLIPKPKKNAGDPVRYRPISLINVFAKILEAMIERRLGDQIDEGGGLSDSQHGFRRGRSTTGAMREVIEIAGAATRVAWQHKSFCALVTLDVKNAFNTARWTTIMKELETRWPIEDRLMELVRSYLQGRVLLVGDTQKRMALTCGVPQGSILGPLLWNVFYDAVFDLELPDGVSLVGYADDLAVVGTAKTGAILQHKINTALADLKQWLTTRHLEVAHDKTEVVLLSGRRRLKEITVTMGDSNIRSRKSLKYLGVYFGKDLRMSEHVRLTTMRAGDVASKLCRLMPNIGGPRSSKRRILGGVINSIILYGASIWGGALKHQKYRVMLLQVQRRVALRVCTAYRTVSTDAALVAAGLIPIDLMVEERAEADRNAEVDRRSRRADTMKKWQDRWDRLEGKAAWTKRLIKDIAAWTGRKHGELNYHITQFLTGHGAFNAYLHRFKRRDTAECETCGKEETAEHVIFECTKWNKTRTEMQKEAKSKITPENIIQKMLENPTNWEKITNALVEIIRTKEESERREE